MVLEANTDVLKSLHTFYHGLFDRKDSPVDLKNACEDDLRTFTSQLDEIINDFHMQTSRAKLLVKIISDRKELVLQPRTRGCGYAHSHHRHSGIPSGNLHFSKSITLLIFYTILTITSDILQHRCCEVSKSR
jgi:hypothetical protein